MPVRKRELGMDLVRTNRGCANSMRHITVLLRNAPCRKFKELESVRSHHARIDLVRNKAQSLKMFIRPNGLDKAIIYPDTRSVGKSRQEQWH